MTKPDTNSISTDKDHITVFNEKLEAFAKAAKELNDAWDMVDGNLLVTKSLSLRWPFIEGLYYNALRDAAAWATDTKRNIRKNQG